MTGVAVPICPVTCNLKGISHSFRKFCRSDDEKLLILESSSKRHNYDSPCNNMLNNPSIQQFSQQCNFLLDLIKYFTYTYKTKNQYEWRKTITCMNQNI